MPFDPISWLIGFGLTQISRSIIDKYHTKTLPKKLDMVVHSWARRLPSAQQLEPTSLFTEGDVIEDESQNTAVNKPLLEELSLLTKEIWFDALWHKWESVRKRLGNDAASFFRIDTEVARAHLQELAKLLEIECIKDREIFQVEVISRLSDIRELLTTYISSTYPPSKPLNSKIILTNPGFMRQCKINGREGMALDYSSMEFILNELVANSILEIAVPANSLAARSAELTESDLTKYVRFIDKENVCSAVRNGLLAPIADEFGFKTTNDIISTSVQYDEKKLHAFSFIHFALHEYLLAWKYRCQVEISIEHMLAALELLRNQTCIATTRSTLAILEGMFRSYEISTIDAVKTINHNSSFPIIAENMQYRRLSQVTAILGQVSKGIEYAKEAEGLVGSICSLEPFRGNLARVQTDYKILSVGHAQSNIISDFDLAFLPPITKISNLINKAQSAWKNAKPVFIAPSKDLTFEPLE